MKTPNKSGVTSLFPTKEDDKNASKSADMDASVLAKLAEDVIAWNRPLTQNEVQEGARPAQVAKLQTMSRGFKIRRSETDETHESQEGVVRLFPKDK